MKIVKLIPVIIKNLILIIIYEIRKLWKTSGIARWIIIGIVLGVILGGAYLGRTYFFFDPNSPDLTLSQAARVGEKTTHKLMVEIQIPPKDVPGQYERGDIIMIKRGDYQFTPGQNDRFLILKMDLTEKQAKLMMDSLKKKTGQKDEKGQPILESVKRRKYAVNLKKVGIKKDDQQGKVIDKVYKWSIVYEK